MDNDNKKSVGSRTARNRELYEDINTLNIDNYEVKSNATVIGDNEKNIDVEKIKSILDTHYNDTPRRKSIAIEETPKKEDKNPILETKEYDINVVLDKARNEKEESYSEDRKKKLRDTDYDILNNLNINDYVEDYEKEDNNKNDENNLMELINTININEKEIREKAKEENNTATDPLDIFEDLKATDDEDELKPIDDDEEYEDEEEEDADEVEEKDNKFFTKPESFSKNDFEDFSDVDDKPNVLIKIIIGVLIVVFIIGLVILVKSFF